MYARAPAKPRPRSSRLKGFPAPTAGWIANRNLAQPADTDSGQGAAILDNFVVTATSAVLRRGKEGYATLGDGTLDVTAMWSYVLGSQEEFFASTAQTVYNITTIVSPANYQIVTDLGDLIVTDAGDTFGYNSTAGLDVYAGLTGGNWITVQFATTGATVTIGVNASDVGFIYDGTHFLPYMAGGVRALNYTSETAAFTAGETLTGGTSGASATIHRVIDSGTTGTLWLTGVAGGPFGASEAITDSDGGAAATNGTDTVLVPGVTFPSPFALTTASLSYVWAYKSRLFFLQEDTLDAWYLDVDQIGGELTRLPLGGIFERGGSLLFGATWSLDSGNQGGLSEQCIFVTTEGEVAVFQGANPGDANDWGKVGVYRIGTPLGNRAFIRAGGDLVIATAIGFVPLSQAIQRDYAALAPAAVSYPIEDAWNEATALRGLIDWQCAIWPEHQMVVVSPPATTDLQPALFIANARTGAWSRFTNWHAKAMEVFRGQLYFGGPLGRVWAANVGGMDDADTYTGIYMPLFEDLGAPASLKIGEIGRAVVRATAKLDSKLSFHADFDLRLPAAPDASAAGSGNEWGTAIWGQSVWGAPTPTVINQGWESVGGSGYAVSMSYQVTSGSVVPLDAEIIRLEMTYQTAEIVT